MKLLVEGSSPSVGAISVVIALRACCTRPGGTGYAARMQKPSIGRIVHYLAGEGQPLAAIITHVWNDACVNLTVFGPNGDTYGRTSVTFGGDRVGDCNWPPRV